MEKELKISLSVEDLTKFIIGAAPQRTEVKNQENRYYTSPELNAARHAVRVRRENGRFILTHKFASTIVDGYSTSEETNEELEIRSFEEFENSMGELPAPAPRELEAQMRTTRVVFELDGFNIECDSVQALFPHEFQFAEIECETEDPLGAERAICGRLASLGIAWRPSTQHKVARVMNGQ